MNQRLIIAFLLAATFLVAGALYTSHPAFSQASALNHRARLVCRIPTRSRMLSTPVRYQFGVINNRGDHYADEWQKGVRITTFELHWKLYEPQEGEFDPAYIDHMKELMTGLKAQGWKVQLVPGYHYAPSWVYTTYPGMRYVNQFGQEFAPDPVQFSDLQVINAPFNPAARTLIARYLQQIFRDFPQDDPRYQFDFVRVGGGPQGELRYPSNAGYPANSYWAFDATAQDPEFSDIPLEIVGWRPGIDPNPGSLNRGQLLVNPGFEVGDEFFKTLGWAPDDEVFAWVITSGAHSGDQALSVAISSPYRVHQFVRVSPGSLYQFGGWVRSANGAGRARLLVTQYDANTQPIETAPHGKAEAQTQEWSAVESSLQTTASTRYLKFELDGDQAGTFYFDDLWLKVSGDPNPADRSLAVPHSFLTFYIQALTGYQNWQINEIRKYYTGQIDILYPGKGLLTNQANDAITNDLAGDGWSESSSALYAGTLFEWHVLGLPQDNELGLFNTGIEDMPPGQVDDQSPFASRWSSAKWIAYLGRLRGLAVWGENSGKNTVEEMQLAAQRMRANGFSGLLWAFESDLYDSSGQYATMEQYASLIQHYSSLRDMYLPLTIKCSR